MSLYYVNVTVHVFAALFWLGGMFFLAAVGAPVLRKVEPAALRASLFEALGRAFRTSGWVAITVLLLTGVGNLYFGGMLAEGVMSAPGFWATPYGRALLWKLGAVIGMVGVSAVHDFVLGPRAGRIQPGTPEAARTRRQAALLARFNALLGIIVVIAAVRLAR
jgi:putative copper resistance protein D